MRVITKARIFSSLQVPFAVFSRFCKKHLYSAQIMQMRELTREAPLFLEIETINICNSSCIFCSYPDMKRKKGVMSLQMFQKVVEDYVRMGGGPVSLTPLEGEPLLDPLLKERLEILKKYPETQQVILTTNGIALNKFSDQEICSLLEGLYLIKFSIGGLDDVTYKSMFNVDCFSQVMNGVDRLLKIREKVSEPAHITFAFRTNDPRFEVRFKSQLDGYREQGIAISHIHAYTNNCGALKSDEEKRLVVARNPGRKHLTCVYPCMSMVVSWDGIVTACCEDSEDVDLRIGHVEKETLAEIWGGKQRQEFLGSFTNRELFPVCRNCSGYQPDTVFVDPCFKGLRPHQKLPKDFIQFR
jgi:radical SAM protein with 4Fe4S-binding SPASM domain